MTLDIDHGKGLEQLQELMRGLPDGTVFGHPVQREGVTLVPAARVRFAGGQGEGEKPETHEGGWGHGYVGQATPMGAFVLTEGEARWVPAVDPQRINLGWQVMATIASVATASAVGRALSRRRRR